MGVLAALIVLTAPAVEQKPVFDGGRVAAGYDKFGWRRANSFVEQALEWYACKKTCSGQACRVDSLTIALCAVAGERFMLYM